MPGTYSSEEIAGRSGQEQRAIGAIPQLIAETAGASSERQAKETSAHQVLPGQELFRED